MTWLDEKRLDITESGKRRQVTFRLRSDGRGFHVIHGASSRLVEHVFDMFLGKPGLPHVFTKEEWLDEIETVRRRVNGTYITKEE